MSHYPDMENSMTNRNPITRRLFNAKSILVVHDRNGDLRTVFRCDSVKEAEAFIAGCGQFDPDVQAGLYSIHAPEEMVNPPNR